MPNYTVKYTRLKPRMELEATITAETMKQAVNKLVLSARKKLIDITSISVSIAKEEKGGVQRFCDGCLLEMASYGINKNWYCKECK